MGTSKLIEKVKKNLKMKRGPHAFDHFVRVYSLAKHIGKTIDHDEKILEAMCYLHDLVRFEDTSREKFNEKKTIQKSKKLLKDLNYSKKETALILAGIKSHSLHYHKRVYPYSIEAKILFDSDKIEGAGHIGVARWFMVLGQKNINVKEAALLYLETIQSERQKIGKLYTARGNDLLAERLKFSENFMKQLLVELNFFESDLNEN